MVNIYIYMLRLAGETAGPIGLKLFADTIIGGRGLKKIDFLKTFSWATPGPSDSFT